MADLSKIPLVALSIDTKILISTLLNPTKWLPNDDGLPRDWRGFAHLCDLDGETLPSIASHSDPTGYIITIVQNNNTIHFTLKDFQSILSKIDRWDVIDDAKSLFERDAEKYLERMERCETSAEDIKTDIEKQILTIDDVYRFRQGLDKQFYDAFLLYSDQDMDFVGEIIENLEKIHKIKLCIKDRDLVGGITFEHEAVMQLISERCNRMIVVVSPNFIKSSANKFFLNYAQAVAIETRQRKVIPCLYKPCEIPPQLCHTFILDYGRQKLLNFDFWGRLRDSVSVVNTESSAKRTVMSQLADKNDKLDSILSDEKKNINACETPIPKLMTNESSDSISLSKIKIKSAQTEKRKKYLPWIRRKHETKSKVSEIYEKNEPFTETVSLSISLPSLDNLPSLDIMKSSTSQKSSKRKKNIVGTCVKKLEGLLTKN